MLPGVYSVECMAQTADILLLPTERHAGKVPLFLGINNMRFLLKANAERYMIRTRRIHPTGVSRAFMIWLGRQNEPNDKSV